MIKKFFCCALLCALLLVFSGCMAGPFVPPYPNLYAQAGGNLAPGFSGGYDEPRMIVRIPLPPGAVETPAGIILKEGVLVPWRDLTYKAYGYQQDLPERWTKWLLEYQRTGKYPGWHPCAGGTG